MSNQRPVADPRPIYIEDPSQVEAQLALGRELITGPVETLYLIGCGGSLGAYGPAEYVLANQVPGLVVQAMTSNEFNYRVPARLGPKSIVVVASHTGTTPETVAAIATARKAGAAQVVALTQSAESPLAKGADIAFTHEPVKAAWDAKEVAILRIAQGIREAAGVLADPGPVNAAFAALPTAIPEALASADPALHSMAEALADEPIIYLLGSGPLECVARGLSMCYLQEMLWKHSAAYNSGEFFHGAFEVATEDVGFIVFAGEDETRPMADRAISFLKRYTPKLHILDSRDLALDGVTARNEIIPIVMSAVSTRIAQHFEAVLDHDLATRRYMFTVEY
ncbi:MAG: SIS domain-containing protein [Propionibacteriaceae bacterium]|jgi:fructoselysine-6-phosphate deglycase|nr:SIS domain-containing protein [Propionibacteriaceae bacterium]